MKLSCYLLICFITLFQVSFAQVDTNKIYNCSQLKRGFYKNYEEYINNSPSGSVEFTTVHLTKSKSDTTIIGAEYKLVDSLQRLKNVWGFCDGESVFVEYNNSLFVKRFWKLEIGIYPFFTYKYKDIYGPGLIKLITIAEPAQFLLMLITDKGKFREPDIKLMRKILKDEPTLLKKFRTYTDRYDNLDPYEPVPEEISLEKLKIIKEFLIKINEVQKSK